MREKDSKVTALVESLKFIHLFKDSLIVVKVGGSSLFEKSGRQAIIQDLCFLRAIGINLIVVHGGGKEVTDMLSRLGHETQFVGGYRYTSKQDIPIVEMVLSGTINKALVSDITMQGGKAVGLSGRDGGMLSLERRKTAEGEDLGEVGSIVYVNPELVESIYKLGYIPVISSIGSGFEGEPLNLNADEVASAIARSLKAKKLVFMTDVDGLIIKDKLVTEADLKEVESFMQSSDVSGGMIPKLEHSSKALRGGVEAVHLINGTQSHSVLLELFTDTGVGTKLSYQRRKAVGK